MTDKFIEIKTEHHGRLAVNINQILSIIQDNMITKIYMKEKNSEGKNIFYKTTESFDEVLKRILNL